MAKTAQAPSQLGISTFLLGDAERIKDSRIFRAGWLTFPSSAWQPGAFWLTVFDCQPFGAAERWGYDFITVLVGLLRFVSHDDFLCHCFIVGLLLLPSKLLILFSLGTPLRTMTTAHFTHGSHEFIGNTWSKSEVTNEWDSQRLTAW